jgi:hypothetical protein
VERKEIVDEEDVGYVGGRLFRGGRRRARVENERWRCGIDLYGGMGIRCRS